MKSNEKERRRIEWMNECECMVRIEGTNEWTGVSIRLWAWHCEFQPSFRVDSVISSRRVPWSAERYSSSGEQVQRVWNRSNPNAQRPRDINLIFALASHTAIIISSLLHTPIHHDRCENLLESTRNTISCSCPRGSRFGSPRHAQGNVSLCWLVSPLILYCVTTGSLEIERYHRLCCCIAELAPVYILSWCAPCASKNL